MYAVNIANFFIKKSKEEDVPITPLKLIKLVYMGYGWVAAVLGEELFEEPIEAWKHGPVISSIYHEFKHFGKQPIDEYGIIYDWEADTITRPFVTADQKDIFFILTYVWDIYKRYNAWGLTKLTHKEDSPWSAFYEKGKRREIPFENIRKHFHEKIKEYLA